MRREDVVSIVLGGGRGTRLDPLTRYRCKPAVPVGGKFRLVDIPISNSLNSSLRRIVVLTQFNSASLNTHIARTYRFDAFGGGFVHVIAAEQTHGDTSWFQGTADAVRRSLMHIAPMRPRDVLILSGDQLYRMNYGPFLRQHRQSEAAVTIAAKSIGAAQTSAFGLMQIDSDRRVRAFLEKPQDPTLLAGFEVPEPSRDPAVGGPQYAASTGIYASRFDALCAVLEDPAHVDFGHDVLPAMVAQGGVRAFPFHGYWEDIGTIRAYFEASLDLAKPKPPFEFHEHRAPIFTEPRFLSASKVGRCAIVDSLLCDGCTLRAASIENSVIGIRTVVREGSRLRNTLVLGADGYERDLPRSSGAPKLGIGQDCDIEGAILDKDVRLGDGVVIRPKPRGTHEDHATHFVRDGLVVVAKGAVLPDRTEI